MQRAVFGKRMTAQASLATLDRTGSSEDAARFIKDILETGESSGKSGAAPASLEHVAWSYFKACVIAFVTAMMLAGFAHSLSNPISSFFARLHYYYAAGAVMLTLAPVLAGYVRRLAELAQRQGIPRGWSDVLIGGVCGGFPLLAQLLGGMKPDSMSIGLLLGGCFGGFYFWRRRGYPGLAREDRGLIERFYRIVDRMRGRLTH